MNILVIVKMVPDLVEELAVDPDGKGLDPDWVRWKPNEFDDHAIEQAILIKERQGAQVTVVIPNMDGAEDALYAAAAKGADRLVKLMGEFTGSANNHALARALGKYLPELQPDLLLTGVQAHNDLDGRLGPLLAEFMGLPYLGYVAGFSLQGGKAIVRKEHPGGVVVEMEINLPAVLGIQAAEQAPRYVAFSRIRQAMKTTAIEEHEIPHLDISGAAEVSLMKQVESGERAEMFAGDADHVADRIVAVLRELGIL